MGNPLSVAIAGIYMAKLERDIVKPEKPLFYKRYLDDVFRRRRVNEDDTLLAKMQNYHENINFTTETNLSKFLDTNLERNTRWKLHHKGK